MSAATMVSAPLRRGREEVRAARVLLDAGFPSQALARAWVAALRGADAALLSVGEAPSTASGVVSAFSRRVVVQGGLDPSHARALRGLYDDGHDVDEALSDAPENEAERAIAQAEALLEACAAWIDGAAAREDGDAAGARESAL